MVKPGLKMMGNCDSTEGIAMPRDYKLGDE